MMLTVAQLSSVWCPVVGGGGVMITGHTSAFPTHALYFSVCY